MARTITYREAINEALAQEMERDESVIVMGEDNAGGEGSPGEMDAWGGVLGVTKGLYNKFPGRVLDTPISESAFIGAAIGAATAGMRPVAELMFVDFMGVCFDQIYNQAAKFRYMFGGKAVTPVVIRTMYGAGLRAAAQHSQCLYPLFTHIPGLKVVLPATPYDAKGLMTQAIRDNDPVMFFEHKALYRRLKGTKPPEETRTPLGRARIARNGSAATVITYGAGVELALGLEHDVEVLDLRTLWPFDREAVLDSIGRTSRALVLQEAARSAGVASHILALLAAEGFELLDAPPVVLAPPDTPVPFAPELEDAYLPSAQTLAATVEELLGY